jgi:chromosome segregation ATPase
VLKEYIPCTPRALPSSAAAAGREVKGMEEKQRSLESKLERQLEEVLQAKAISQKELSKTQSSLGECERALADSKQALSQALADLRSAQDDVQHHRRDLQEAQDTANSAWERLSKMHEDLRLAKEAEATALAELKATRSDLLATKGEVQSQHEALCESKAKLASADKERRELLSKLTLLQAKLNIASASPANVDSPEYAAPEEDENQTENNASGRETASMNEKAPARDRMELNEVGQDNFETSLQAISKLQAENDILVEACKGKTAEIEVLRGSNSIKTQELDVLQGKVFGLETRLHDASSQIQFLGAEMQKCIDERSVLEEKIRAQGTEIGQLSVVADHHRSCAGIMTSLKEEAKRLSDELQTCNDALEQEWKKTSDQDEIMKSLAADVSQWQSRYEELEARGVDNMFERSDHLGSKTNEWDASYSMATPSMGGTEGKGRISILVDSMPIADDEIQDAVAAAVHDQMSTTVQTQVAAAMQEAMVRISGLEREKSVLEQEKQCLQQDVEQAKLDKDVLDVGLDEAMKQLRQQARELAALRGLSSEARLLAEGKENEFFKRLAAYEAQRLHSVEGCLVSALEESSNLRIGNFNQCDSKGESTRSSTRSSSVMLPPPPNWEVEEGLQSPDNTSQPVSLFH